MIGLIWLGWKLIVFAIKATWGIAKVLLYIVCFPIILIGLVLGGLIYIALPILVVAGIIALLCGE
jgi:hypothetical protein